MPYLIVRQDVEDFDRWYSIFRADREAQRDAGLRNPRVLRDVEEPNVVVCMFEVEDLERARAFTEAPGAEESKEKAGVLGDPRVLLLEEV